MNNILLASIQAETNGDVVIGDLADLFDELTDEERERFRYFYVRPDSAMYHVYAYLSEWVQREDVWGLAPEDEER
jgi:hypothetical protein